MSISWLLLTAPLASALIIFLVFRRNAPWAMGISVAASAVAFLVAVGLFTGFLNPPGAMLWLEVHTLRIDIGWYLNDLAKAMLLVVTGIGLLVHIFSIGYMDHDPSKARFFGELSLFMFSMLGIVVADNLVMMYIFWELVGLSSYLLVGFWFERPAASAAAKKAFLCNRLGDFGFLLGILLFWFLTGTIFINDTEAVLGKLEGRPEYLLTALGLLLFCGCVGKSAQFPLHVWLPDAMEGPTPVSALIHAATMVAAGVYMLCRVFFILELSATTLAVIGWLGAFMTLFAALIGTQQDDIKRILAYSTLSQLGYMVLAVGAKAPGLAMFHLSTHACFKGLLFLGAGSIIHACHEEQSIWKMGGLLRRMPVTAGTFVVGSLALAGLIPFSGFFSKDPIIDVAMHENTWWGVLALVAAGFTAYYMFRLMIVAFLGEPRSEKAGHAHESPPVMLVPLCILAVFALAAGWPVFHWEEAYVQATGQTEPVPALGFAAIAKATVVFALGAGAAWLLYAGRSREPLTLAALRQKFYVDEFYDRVLLPIQQGFARLLAWIDNWVLGGLVVRGLATGSNVAGELLRLFQTGSLQAYTFLFSLGAALLIYLVLF